MKNDSRIQIELAEARKSIESGNVRSMELYLSKAKRYAREVKEDISEKVAEIVGIGYKNGLELELAEARKFAESGDASSMEINLLIAWKCATYLGENISERVDKIEGIGYKNGLEPKLAEVRRFAESGDTLSMGNNLFIAQKCATYLREDISERVDEIERIGLKNGLEPDLAEARKFAVYGDASSMENYLNRAQEYATIVEEDISQKVAEI